MATRTRPDTGPGFAEPLPSSLTRPERAALARVTTDLWQQAIGLDAVVPEHGVEELLDSLYAAPGPWDAPAFVHAWSCWAEILDHRCEDPATIAAAVLDCATGLVSSATTGWRAQSPGAHDLSGEPASTLLTIVRAHPAEPGADAMVLSDVLLHFVGEVDDTGRLAVQLDNADTGLVNALPPMSVLDTTDSIYYTPEARARLEARAQLNLARRRAKAQEHIR